MDFLDAVAVGAGAQFYVVGAVGGESLARLMERLVGADGVEETVEIDRFFGKDKGDIAVGAAEGVDFVGVGASGVEIAAVEREGVFVGADAATDSGVVVVADAEGEMEDAVAAYGAGEVEGSVLHIAGEGGTVVAEGGHAVLGDIDAVAAEGSVVDGEGERDYGVAAVGGVEIDMRRGVVDGGVGYSINPPESVATADGMAVAEGESRPDFEIDVFDAVAAVGVVEWNAVCAFGGEDLA